MTRSFYFIHVTSPEITQWVPLGYYSENGAVNEITELFKESYPDLTIHIEHYSSDHPQEVVDFIRSKGFPLNESQTIDDQTLDTIERVTEWLQSQSTQLPRWQFVGVQALKTKQANHLRKLQRLAMTGNWQAIQEHTGHPHSGFDWWMFPINRESMGEGPRYQVNNENIAELKQDQEFMNSYREGVKLVMLSWGWDADSKKDVSNEVQRWTNYQVRLGKMAHSLILFEQDDLLRSLQRFVFEKGIFPTLEPWIQDYLRHNF